MSDENERSVASTGSIAMKLTDEQVEEIARPFREAVEWLANMPSEDALSQALILSFLAGRGATSEETSVPNDEMDRFGEYVYETIRRCRLLGMVGEQKGTADFSGEQPTFFEFTTDEQ